MFDISADLARFKGTLQELERRAEAVRELALTHNDVAHPEVLAASQRFNEAAQTLVAMAAAFHEGLAGLATLPDGQRWLHSPDRDA